MRQCYPILMEKDVDATHSRQFATIQLPGVYCRKTHCSTVPETDRPITPSQVISASMCAAPVSLVSRYGNDSQQRGIGFVLAKSLHVTIYVTNSPGSRKSLLLVFVAHLSNRCRYRTSTRDMLWCDVGGWLVVGCHEGGL